MIVVSELHKSFGEVEALKGVSFTVPQGTVLGLLGPNGAGKTTAVRILTTILNADFGSAWIDGFNVADEPQRVREVIGLAGQNAALDENLTGFENIRMIGRLNHMSKSAVKERAFDLLALFNLEDAASRPVKTYSGGMRRRLDLAAALVTSPRVLFLDEPTTGLDPKSRNDLWDIVDDLADSGSTVLLTTQYMEEADRLADNLVIINHGLVVAEGHPEDLKDEFGESTLDGVFLALTGEGNE